MSWKSNYTRTVSYLDFQKSQIHLGPIYQKLFIDKCKMKWNISKIIYNNIKSEQTLSWAKCCFLIHFFLSVLLFAYVFLTNVRFALHIRCMYVSIWNKIYFTLLQYCVSAHTIITIQVDSALWQMRPSLMRPYANPALYQMDVPALSYIYAAYGKSNGKE